MNKIELGKYKAEIPAKLEELTQSQLFDLASCRMQKLKLIDAQVLLAACWAGDVFKLNEQLINRTTKRLRTSTDKEQLTEYLQGLQYNRMHLADLCGWINDDHVCKKWLIASLDLEGETYLGPSHLFADVEFWEWCRMEQYWELFQSNGDINARNAFLSILFHPVKDDKRLPFTDGEFSKYQNVFNELPVVTFEAIAINYIAFKGWLARQHPHVFKKREEKDGPVQKANMKELLLRTAMEQHMDEEIVAKKPLLIELGKMEIKGKDIAAQINNQPR